MPLISKSCITSHSKRYLQKSPGGKIGEIRQKNPLESMRFIKLLVLKSTKKPRDKVLANKEQLIPKSQKFWELHKKGF